MFHAEMPSHDPTSALIYVSETWPITKVHEVKLDRI